MKIAVCDDEKYFNDTMATMLKKILNEKSFKADVSTYTDPAELLSAFDRENFDAVYIDIYIPDFSGYELANELRKRGSDVLIIFITERPDLVFGSFEYRPLYFIVKNSYDKLVTEVSHTVDMICDKMKQHKMIKVSDARFGKRTLCVKDIIYIYSDKHYVYYHMNLFEAEVRERTDLANLEERIASSDIVKLHRRYYANLRYIRMIDEAKRTATMSDGSELPISLTCFDDVFARFIKYQRR